MAQSKSTKSIQANNDSLADSNKKAYLLPLLADDFKYDAPDSDVQDAFKIVSGFNKADRSALSALKQFIYGDSSLHGSGYWNDLSPHVKPALEQVLVPAEAYLLNELRQSINTIQSLKETPSSGDISSDNLARMNSIIKKSLRDSRTVTTLLAGGMIKVDDAIQFLEKNLINQAFDAWGSAFSRFRDYNNLLQTRQDNLNKFYRATEAMKGRSCWDNKGYAPFRGYEREMGDLPPPREYELSEPEGFQEYFRKSYPHENLFWTDLRGYPNTFGNAVRSIEYQMEKWMEGQNSKQMKQWDDATVRGYQYWIAMEHKRIDRDFSSAINLTARVRGSRRVGTFILQSLKGWKKGYTETILPSLSQLQLALWKLYGNLYSADNDEIALNWAELAQACQKYTAVTDSFIAAPASTFDTISDEEEQLDKDTHLLP
ncbi:hypothetical protein N431DRAFT_458801 [Stipitochalara longipes BDJ]|nr:hypothetical protein N431DRAFT_458801 [Stipitochalara longipes BDJ]